MATEKGPAPVVYSTLGANETLLGVRVLAATL